MSKQVSQKKAQKKPAVANKTGARKPAVAAKLKSSGKSKAAAVKKTVQRKEATPAAKAKSAVKSAVKASVKAPVRAARSPASRKPATSKPSRAKSIADSKKAPAVTKKPVTEKEAEKKIARSSAPLKPSPKVINKEKPAPASDKKSSGPVATGAAITAQVEKPVPQAPAVPYKAPTEFDGFRVNDHVVYPTHGVGKIVAVEAQEIVGTRLELFVIAFEQEKMTLRVPLGKAKAVGMRILSSRDTVRNALKTLRGRARIKRTMWSRRAQEYEAKINSGDLLLIAEVVRDLHRAEGQPEQSYSERQIYESALDRMAREVGAVEELDATAALERVGVALKKAA